MNFIDCPRAIATAPNLCVSTGDSKTQQVELLLAPVGISGSILLTAPASKPQLVTELTLFN